jgi:transposase-like protein
MIDYKNLRRINPEAARQAVLDYLDSTGGVSATARIFGINRSVVYDIQRRARDGNLADRSHAPHRQPNRTPKRTENRVIAARNRTGFGYRRLRRYLAARGLDMPLSTIRKILKRHRHRLDPPSRLRARAEAIRAREAAAKDAVKGAEKRAYIRRRALLDRAKSFYN